MSRTIKQVQLIRTFMLGGAVVVPGLPPFLEQLGTNIFSMELLFALGMMLTLVATGLLAAKVGDKPILIAGSVLMLLGTVFYLVANGVFFCILAELCIGAGLGCIFGSDESLLYRTLLGSKDRNSKFDYNRQWGCSVMLQVLFVSVCFLIGGITYRIHPRIPFWLALLNYSMVFLASLCIKESVGSPEVVDWRGLIRVLRKSSGLCWVIAVYASFLAFIRVSFWGYEKFFIESQSPINHGTVMAIGALFSAAIISHGHSIRERISLPMLTAIVGAGFALSLVCMGAFVAPWCFILVIATQIASGFMQNTYASELHRFISADSQSLRAAIASFRQMMFLLCYIVVTLAVHFFEEFKMAEILFGLGSLALASALLLVVIAYALPELKSS